MKQCLSQLHFPINAILTPVANKIYAIILLDMLATFQECTGMRGWGLQGAMQPQQQLLGTKTCFGVGGPRVSMQLGW